MAGEIIYGFHQLADILGERVSDNNTAVVTTAITQAVEEHNRQLDAMLGLFVTRRTDVTVRYKQFGRSRSQPLDQNGRARPIKAAGHYDVAFPIQGSGSAWGVNYVTREMMTVQDANDATRTLIDGDVEWVGDHILASLFANASWTFPDEEKGSLTIRGLANGDSTTYAVFSGAAGGATDTHYLAQAADISDSANPFPTIAKELNEHPENGGQIVALVASDLIDDIEGLAAFKERSDPNIRVGIGNDELIGTLSTSVPGVLKGYVNGVWIVEWARMPSGYMLAVATEGQRPLAMREYPVASLQGFRLVGQRDDHPFYESQYARWAGFGGWNRVGALAYRVGNANYAVPSNYSVPMA